jgi:hypothetical protein
MISQSLIDTLVEQNTHSRFGGQKLLSFFECSDGHLAGEAGESLQKLFQCFSAFQRIKQRLQRDAGSPKDGCAPEDLRVPYDDRTFRFHRVLPMWSEYTISAL